MAKDEKDESTAEEEVKKGGSSMKVIIIAVVLTLVIGGGLVGGTFYFVNGMNADKEVAETDGEGGEEGDEEEAAVEVVLPPMYQSMDPKFVVSFGDQSRARFMQFSLEIMSRDGDVIAKIKDHMPVVRSSLLMLFGSQTYEVMSTREGKQKLLQDTAADINTTLKKITGDTDNEEDVAMIEAAYFNSFVIQ